MLLVQIHHTIIAQIRKLTPIEVVIHVASVGLVCGCEFPALALAVDPGHRVRRCMNSDQSAAQVDRGAIACRG